MTKNKLEYRKYAAFINRQRELKFLKNYIDDEPESILFLHGPKSSGIKVPGEKYIKIEN